MKPKYSTLLLLLATIGCGQDGHNFSPSPSDEGLVVGFTCTTEVGTPCTEEQLHYHSEGEYPNVEIILNRFPDGSVLKGTR